MTDPVSAILCALFAVQCVPVPPSGGIPTWQQTAPIATPLIQSWEGRPCTEQRCAAYLDRLPDPDVWTVCDGITRYSDGTPVASGDVLTPAQCDAEFAALVRLVYWQGWRGGLTALGLRTLTAHADAAMTSLTYNIGTGAIRRSTATRRMNAGDLAGSCEAGTWFDRSGGRQWPGLVRRRGCEYRVCVGQVRICTP